MGRHATVEADYNWLKKRIEDRRNYSLALAEKGGEKGYALMRTIVNGPNSGKVFCAGKWFPQAGAVPGDKLGKYPMNVFRFCKAGDKAGVQKLIRKLCMPDYEEREELTIEYWKLQRRNGNEDLEKNVADLQRQKDFWKGESDWWQERAKERIKDIEWWKERARINSGSRNEIVAEDEQLPNEPKTKEIERAKGPSLGDNNGKASKELNMKNREDIDLCDAKIEIEQMLKDLGLSSTKKLDQ